MPKYRIPIVASTYVEVEAVNLDRAMDKVYSESPDIPGVDKSQVSLWEIDNWAPVEKDGATIKDNNGELYISDIMDRTQY